MKNVFLFLFAFACLLSDAQTFSGRDTLVTTDGKVHPGKLLDISKDQYIKFKTQDGIVRTIPYSYINFALSKLPEKVGTYDPKAYESANSSDGGGRSDATLPQSLIRKRNTGVGLTIAGSTALLLGSILIAVNPQSINTTRRAGYAQANFGGAAAVGLVLDIAGLPMAIAGIVKLMKANKQAAYYHRLDKEEGI